MLDYLNTQVQNAYLLPEDADGKEKAVDFMWYLWCGAKSPVFGKSKLSAFEHYFIDDKEMKKEQMNPYYKLSEQKYVIKSSQVGLDPVTSHIINGHVPVKIKDGEKPVKAGGKLYVIDGGISKAYQSKTGIAGYTLIFNSHCLALAEHRNYMKMEGNPTSYAPEVHVIERFPERMKVVDTDIGVRLEEQIDDLKALVHAYREGVIKEK